MTPSLPAGERRGTAAEIPIVPGVFPDPTICRVGPDYFLAHSSFEYFPGAPLFHSQDLLTWSQIGNILDRRSQFRRGDGRSSAGIYGSTLRHRAGQFWFATTNVSDFESGIVIVHTEDPAGPWSDPVFVPEAVGIDPDLCWDHNDQCYLTWKAMAPSFREVGILQARLDLTTGLLIDRPYPIWQGTGLQAAEAPHLYQIGDFWYLLLAEGGTERGHCVTVARAGSPDGPFEPCPSNPIFTRRSTDHPVQSVGHADLVETAGGDWAAVYLGTRPRGSTPGFHVLGRETFITGVQWADGWPVFAPGNFDVVPADTGVSDDFSAPRLDPRWVVPGGEPESVAQRHAAGGLDLRRSQDRSGDLLCTRVRDLEWIAEARFDGPGQLRVWLDGRHWCGLSLEGSEARATVRMGPIEQVLNSVSVTTAEVTLRISCGSSASAPLPLDDAGPDELVLSIDLGDFSHELARLDGRYFSTEVAAGFTGRMLAIGSPEPRARLLSLTYVPNKAWP